MSIDEILAQLRKYQPIVQSRFRAQLAGVFGSRARGDSSPKSDLDVLVNFNPGADFFDLVALSNFLEDNFHCPVDVVPVDSLRTELRNQILAEAVFL